VLERTDFKNIHYIMACVITSATFSVRIQKSFFISATLVVLTAMINMVMLREKLSHLLAANFPMQIASQEGFF
jgi:hypothetical protein